MTLSPPPSSALPPAPPRAGASRRTLLGAAGAATVAGATVGTGVLGDEAAASTAPRRRRAQPVLSPKQRHLVGRFSYGVTPALAREVRRAGGATRWFEQQLRPSAIKDRDADALSSWWPSLNRSCTDLWRRQVQQVEGGWEVMFDYQRWVLARRMRSRRQVLEVMTELWENHFNVPANGDPAYTWRPHYGRTIRAHALGRFEDLLLAVGTHPALLINLDNVSSTRRHPNENLGRELLELYTVGRGHYSEDDVKASARILTGWSVDMWDTFTPVYDSSAHWRGPVQVMGFKHANAAADGRDVTRAYLRYLAHHPGTADRVARKLAVKFVSDNPPQALVSSLARVYLRSGTDIRAVLRALVRSKAFAASVGSKVRDPGEDLVATYRVLGIGLRKPPAGKAGDEYAANALLWQVEGLGIRPFDWPRPDGQPIDSVSWSSPSRIIASFTMHRDLAGGWWPSKGAAYRRKERWLPRKKVRFDTLVDHLSRSLLHRPASARLLKACCQATGTRPHEVITAEHGLVRWNMHLLLGTVLDSPAHMTR